MKRGLQYTIYYLDNILMPSEIPVSILDDFQEVLPSDALIGSTMPIATSTAAPSAAQPISATAVESFPYVDTPSSLDVYLRQQQLDPSSPLQTDATIIQRSAKSCQYGCPIGLASGQTLVPKANFVLTYNGCGPSGTTFPVPNCVTPCCNQHDLAYSQCGLIKDTADQQLYSCVSKACAGIGVLNVVKKAWCDATDVIIRSAVDQLGCTPYQKGQAEACDCQSSFPPPPPTSPSAPLALTQVRHLQHEVMTEYMPAYTRQTQEQRQSSLW